MGLLVLGLILSCLIGAIVARLTMRLFRRWQDSRLLAIGAIAFGTIAFLAVVAPVTQWLMETSTTTLIAMDPRDGEQRLESFGVPLGTTSDFCYRFSLVGVTILADFDMAAEDFQAWMHSQGWPVKRIVSESEYWDEDNTSDIVVPEQATVCPVRDYDPYREIQVQRGYFYFSFEEDNPDETTTVVYDSESGRAYLAYTTY